MGGALQMRKAFLCVFFLANLGLFILYRFQKDSIRVGLSENFELAILATIMPFSLVREDSSEFSSQQLERAPWIASFIFTRCPNQCPMMMSRLAAIQKNLPPSIKIISFSVDPSHDTPDALKAYGVKFGVDLERWALLTGEPGALRIVRRDFMLGEDDDPAMHSLRFVLVDEKMRVRGYYNSQDMVSLKKMQDDALKVLNDRG